MKKSLTIAVSNGNSYLNFFRSQINLFIKKNPNVKIAINEDYGGSNTENEIAEANETILNGTIDLIDCSFIDYNSFGTNGHFIDYCELINHDETFLEKICYKNVLEALKFNNKLYVFPIWFIYLFLGISSKLPENLLDEYQAYDSITHDNIIKIYEQLSKSERLLLYEYFSVSSIVPKELARFIDFKNKKCDLNNSQASQILKDTMIFSDPRTLRTDAYHPHNFIGADTQKLYLEKYTFMESYPFNIELFIDTEYNYYSNYIPYLTSKKELVLPRVFALAINRASKNKELAWEFVKFLTSKEANQPFFCPEIPPVPIRKDVFEFVYRARCKKQWTKMLDRNIKFDSSNRDEKIDDIIAKINLLNESKMLFTDNYGFNSIIYDAIVPYMDGDQSIEDTLNKLQVNMQKFLQD